MELKISATFGVKEWQGLLFYEANKVEHDTTQHRKKIGAYGLNKGKGGHATFLPKEWHNICLSYNGHSHTLSGVWVSQYFRGQKLSKRNILSNFIDLEWGSSV